tara:strand:+ start:61 stop:309 length:249 start_codon:yes stop_codon:yes gene_type:complete
LTPELDELVAPEPGGEPGGEPAGEPEELGEPGGDPRKLDELEWLVLLIMWSLLKGVLKYTKKIPAEKKGGFQTMYYCVLLCT